MTPVHFETDDDDDGDDDNIHGWERNNAYIMYLAALSSYKKPSPGPTFFLADQQSK